MKIKKLILMLSLIVGFFECQQVFGNAGESDEWGDFVFDVPKLTHETEAQEAEFREIHQAKIAAQTEKNLKLEAQLAALEAQLAGFEAKEDSVDLLQRLARAAKASKEVKNTRTAVAQAAEAQRQALEASPNAERIAKEFERVADMTDEHSSTLQKLKDEVVDGKDPDFFKQDFEPIFAMAIENKPWLDRWQSCMPQAAPEEFKQRVTDARERFENALKEIDAYQSWYIHIDWELNPNNAKYANSAFESMSARFVPSITRLLTCLKKRPQTTELLWEYLATKNHDVLEKILNRFEAKKKLPIALGDFEAKVQKDLPRVIQTLAFELTRAYANLKENLQDTFQAYGKNTEEDQAMLRKINEVMMWLDPFYNNVEVTRGGYDWKRTGDYLSSFIFMARKPHGFLSLGMNGHQLNEQSKR